MQIYGGGKGIMVKVVTSRSSARRPGLEEVEGYVGGASNHFNIACYSVSRNHATWSAALILAPPSLCVSY